MGRTRIFFATDIHGSERAFLKFLTAGTFYKANAVILGGDITGKMIVPIVKRKDGTHEAQFLGSQIIMQSEVELQALEKNIRLNGQYPHIVTEEEKARLDVDPNAVDKLFTDIMTDSVKRWVGIAEKRLANSGVRCYLMPGNDDRFELDSVLEESRFVVNPEGKVLQIDDSHEMISTGFANMTPWNCPRDIPENELAQKIQALAQGVADMQHCIFNFHCPPFGSGLDSAPELKDLKPTGISVPVGSVAVRDAIEKYQPLLSLNGHIHESYGFRKIGRTLCLNPGSEYSEGILRGVVINLDKDKFTHLFVRA